MKEIVVVGAGASGLVAAIFAKNNKNNVTILERFDKAARKVLVSGNGRCNYWNEDQDLKRYHSSDDEFINKVITKENQEAALNFFRKLGVEPFIRGGYYYPYSMQSVTIKNLLLKEIKRKNINIIYEADVYNIVKEENKFKIYYDNVCIEADKVIMAAGSNAYYKEENITYSILRSMGHRFIPILPSLVQLVSRDRILKHVKGIRCNARVSILINDEVVKKEEGELQFTEYGLSGICIFNLSREASINLTKNKKVEISINFIHEFDNDFIDKRSKIVSHDNIFELLEGIINEKLLSALLINMDINKKYEELSIEEKSTLYNLLTDYKVRIIDTNSFKEAQVSIGGISVQDINPLTMESKVVDGLYAVGEFLDVDGDCGGYNLAFAWMSGIIAGRSVNND